MIKKSDLIIKFDQIGSGDEKLVGKVAVHFGELVKFGIPVPKGFVVSPNAYLQFFSHNDLPEDLVRKIFKAYKKLDSPLRDATVVVSSSFANKSFLNVKGEANLIQKIKTFWSNYPSYNPTIIVYKMPKSSNFGVMFTIDPETGDKNTIVINEGGNVYRISKQDVSNISKKHIIDLANFGIKLQKLYYFPQEVQYFIDKDRVYITKTKPLTIADAKGMNDSRLVGKILTTGRSIYPGIATGHLRIISRPHDVQKLKLGDIAVVTNTKNLNLNDFAQKSKAIVLESQSQHLPSHISPRFYGKPMIITTPNASKGLKDGLVATVNAVKGQIYV
jgi:phosphoenolpyruvate synthase/pyruvate phosphate dikinase